MLRPLTTSAMPGAESPPVHCTEEGVTEHPVAGNVGADGVPLTVQPEGMDIVNPVIA